MCKLFAADMVEHAPSLAVHLFGGNGYTAGRCSSSPGQVR